MYIAYEYRVGESNVFIMNECECIREYMNMHVCVRTIVRLCVCVCLRVYVCMCVLCVRMCACKQA